MYQPCFAVYIELDVSALNSFGENVIAYSANRIGCEEVDGVLIAGIGNEAIGYVMFQRGTTSETGSDEPPYFEFDDQCSGGTDILRSVILKRDKILIKTKLPAEADEFEVALDATSEEKDLLAAQLRAIFRGHADKLHLELE
jgi:hypothetical protein